MFRSGNFSNSNQISQLCTLLEFAVEEGMLRLIFARDILITDC